MPKLFVDCLDGLPSPLEGMQQILRGSKSSAVESSWVGKTFA